VVIVEIGRKAVGVVVDNVRHVIRVAPSELSPSPPFIGGLSGRYVNGVAKLGDRLIVVLDMDKILTVPEMIELDALKTGTGGEKDEL
jgi:purine-binding chemotaxis protein CheW